ncbi:MAG TPA: hypothetical protein RMH99_03370 [Sandaracinaceae bacterium LLY-WYZ-13_1]|nr:hypothetical protein [Sandaracinaceae bacterium LLY-WYZ-13_1]
MRGFAVPSPSAPAAPIAATAGLRVTDTAFPEAVERVVPRFVTRDAADREPLLRWVTGLERPVAYALESPEDTVLLSSAALRGVGLTRGGIHERALANARRRLPPGFGPGADPAILDDGADALLALPELVPAGESWLAYPLEDGALVVLREGAEGAEEELRRLADEPGAAGFERPVRVRRRGFEPADWPARRARGTDPGDAFAPAPDEGGER